MKGALWLAFFVFVIPGSILGLARIFFSFPFGKLLLAVIAATLPIYLLLLVAINRFSLDRVDGAVEIKAAFLYSAKIEESALAQAQEFPNAGALGEFTPSLRTNGIGMPGIAIGHFRLKGGRSGILFVHDTARPILAIERSDAEGVVIVNRHLVR